MLLSINNRLLCIAIPKTGSASVRNTLQESGADNVFKSLGFTHHMTAIEARHRFNKIGLSWHKYFKFTTTRNPWERYLSMYNYIQHKVDDFEQISKLLPSKGKNLKVNQFNRYKIFINNYPRFEMALPELFKLLKPQAAFYEAPNGDCLIDFIADLSDLDQSLNLLATRIGIRNVETLHLNNTKNNKPYQEFYTPKMMEMVKDREVKVIDKMEYQF